MGDTVTKSSAAQPCARYYILKHFILATPQYIATAQHMLECSQKDTASFT